MTISAVYRADAIGNNSASAFSYGFKVFAATHLEVKVRDSDGVETTLTYPTHYTVSGVGNRLGGNVTLVDYEGAWQNSDATLKTGYTISIRRVVPVLQGTDIRNQGGFFADTHEDAFDYMTMISQQLQDGLDRAMKLSSSYDPADFDMELPAPIAGAAIGWGDDGVSLVNLTTFDGVTLPLSVANGGTGGTSQATARAGIGAAASSDVTALAATVASTYAPLASPTFTGNPTVPTASVGDNDTTIANTAFVTAAISANPSVLPLSLQDGMKLSNNATDATNDIDISAGLWASDDALASNRVQMLMSALTKQLDAAWAVGTNQGMRDTGSIANGTWHIYAIKRTDTNVVDAIASLTPDRPAATVTMTIASPGVVTFTGHGLVAGASVVFTTTGALPTGVTAGTTYYVISTGLSADTFQFSATQGGAAVNTSGSQSGTHTCTPTPVMPANYTKKRRIGSILRESATIVPFVQDGDRFMRNTPVRDVSALNPGSSAVTRTLSVPVGIQVGAIMNVALFTQAGRQAGFYISALAQNDTTSTFSTSSVPGAGPGYQVAAHANATDVTQSSGVAKAMTNYSAQVRSRADITGANDYYVGIYTQGWIDFRGRNA